MAWMLAKAASPVQFANTDAGWFVDQDFNRTTILNASSRVGDEAAIQLIPAMAWMLAKAASPVRFAHTDAGWFDDQDFNHTTILDANSRVGAKQLFN